MKQLAVTIPEERRIVFLSIADRLTEVRPCLKVDGKCKDLAYSDGKLVVTFEWPGKVQIINEKGHIFRTIEKNSHGEKLFGCPMVTISKDDCHIFVSDYHYNAVTRLNWEGEITGVYRNQSLVRPCGLDTTEDGSVIVCSSGNNTIHLLSPDFVTSRVIIAEKDVMKCPWSVALGENTMFVGSGSSCDFVAMYDINWA
ncbi:uncharacterized protein LOC128554291 [Mercenaria mercenaria]|uniref:uncharacterized protein LOC128554291 n=1 Tax=Mercenaria mercenaria TaxID=6596 RepID=UPI00234E7714|nr:uncharacterized protein LOC128554291 [Mercenaria mercenaria]